MTFDHSHVQGLKRLLSEFGDDPVLAPQILARLDEAERTPPPKQADRMTATLTEEEWQWLLERRAARANH